MSDHPTQHAKDKLHAMIATARELEDESYRIAGYVTESYTDLEGNRWARGPSAVSHAALDVLRKYIGELTEARITTPGPAAAFQIGDLVSKAGGDYRFDGKVVASFVKLSGVRRYVVEDDRGALFICGEPNLAAQAKGT